MAKLQVADNLYLAEIDCIFASLSSDERGLSQDQVKERRSNHGLNRIERLKKEPIVLTFLNNFTHTMALLLWAGGAIALCANMNQLAIAIWLVNIINGLFSFWQEFKAERATEALLRLVPKQARVLRDGSECQLPAEQLVPGDVIFIEEGDEVAADARIFEDRGLYVDQSLLTGESAPVRKTASDGPRYHHPNRGHADVLYAGTSITAGQAKAIVITTGMKTRFGQIAHLTQAIRNEESPLQKEMARVTRTVTILALTIGVTFFMVAVLLIGVSLQDSFVFALGMIVAFVPEGMLPTVSLSLAIAVQQMSARNAIVRRLSSVETLGCTTVICSDKTGTLTRNEMMITNLWCPDQEVSISGSGYEPAGLIRTASGTILSTSIPAPLVDLLHAGARCCNARLLEPSVDNPRWRIIGDPTEAAILVAHRKIESFNTQTAAATIYGGVANEVPHQVDCIAFDPHRKRMSVVWKEGQQFVSYVKGSPKEILDSSVSTMEKDCEVRLDENRRDRVNKAVDQFASCGLRVLGIASKKFSEQPEAKEELLERGLTFLGLVAMLDPLHEEVPDALTCCHEAGIKVIMITGDYELTAASVARHAGIITSDNAAVLTGRRLAELDDDQLKEMLKGEIIFARTSPEDKLRIVKVLQSTGHVVAVTGDGVNDAPALKQADIGIAMGKAGTDVARESADIVLSDDNFASIVAAIELGRSVYDNIRKFAAYVFTSNVAEAAPFAVLLLSRGVIPLPMTLMQVLFIDLGTDMMPAIGLGADPPDPDVMKRRPRNPSDRLLSRALLTKVFCWYGLIEAIAGLSAYFFANWIFGWPTHGLASAGSENYRVATTAAVAAVVVCQIGAVFCCRTSSASIFRKSPAGNRLLSIGVLVEILFLFAVMVLPPFKTVFGTELLPLPILTFVILWLPILVAADELRKLFLRNSKHFVSFLRPMKRIDQDQSE